MIAYLLLAIALYCSGSWLFTVFSMRNLRPDGDYFLKVNAAAFQLGVCAILSLGFAGLIFAQ